MELLGMTFTAFKTCAKTTNCGDHSALVSGLTQKVSLTLTLLPTLTLTLTLTPTL